MVSNSSARVQQLHTAQLLLGPAQKALMYAYSYAYPKGKDALSIINSQDVKFHFTDGELELLKKSRSASLFPVSLLCKILRFCCVDKLVDGYDSSWDATVSPSTPSLEHHVAVIHHVHDLFERRSPVPVDSLAEAILGVVQRVGEQLGVVKWKQQLEAVKLSITEILEDVHPGMDVNERTMNAVRIESDLRLQELVEAVCSYHDKNRNISLLDDDDTRAMENLKMGLKHVSIKINSDGTAIREESERNIPSDDLLVELQTRCNEHIDGKKICCISGDHGSGKTSLASSFAVSWIKQPNAIENLRDFDFLLMTSGNEVEQTSINKWVGATKSQRNDLDNFIDEFWSVVEAFLPKCCAKYGVKNVGKFLATKKVLFIIDDAEEMSEAKAKETVLFFGQILFESSVIILGNPESVDRLKFDFTSYSSVQHFHLKGVSMEYLHELGTRFKEPTKTGKRKVQKSFRDAIKSDLNRLRQVLEYPELCKEAVALFKKRPAIVKECFSASELLWEIFLFKSSLALGVDLDKDLRRRKKWFKWMMVVGENCHHCLKRNSRLNEASLEEIKEESDKIFGSEESSKLMNEFFKSRLVFSGETFHSIPSSTSKCQLLYFATYCVANKLKTEESIASYVPQFQAEEMIVMVAGHIKRWDKLEDSNESGELVPEETMKAVIQSLVNYAPGKSEDVTFLFKIATEFRCSHKIVQYMVNVTEYPEEWDLRLCFIYQRTLEVMLQHVAPVRIILRTDELCQNYEQNSVLKFLCQVPISVWFESKQQFEYGDDKKMDKMVKPFLNKEVRSRVDLLSGALTTATTMDLADFKSMSYLVMLALRVQDEEALRAAVGLPAHLRQLLWFELKIDMNIENIVLSALPSMKVELFDVYLRDLDDLCVPRITGLLMKLHKRYSGIHLDNTTLSPESIYTLLKELKNKGITLSATKKSIDKYRRWYYPLLSNLPTDRLLEDTEVQNILGFDDRKFYCDHKIQSSMFVKSIDAWNLTSYLEELKEIKHFVYKADNLSFIKTLEGEVETEHHSSIKVDTTGTIL
ncbi:P-loop containing nucleoside triphosphate hydrolase [Trinorchestia longiramus]|nr:P-loop containing nucleoside triphosphate hydrolase [Trinorchestia longiramus]